MVSQPEPLDRSLTIRPPPSVTSRASTTRRHRAQRSNTGGSSYQPQNEFPYFSHTGDVEICISAGGREQRYLLHRLILAQCSGFFEIGTSQEWSRQQQQPGQQQLPQGRELAVVGENEVVGNELGRSGPAGRPGERKTRWRYELDGGNRDDEIPMLVQKNPSATIFGGGSSSSSDHSPRPPPIRNKPPTPQAGFFRSMANLSALHTQHATQPAETENDTIRDYDNLFRIFYNYPPNLDSVNIANAYVQCKSLLNLADMYDALDVIGSRVDHHLLRFQGRLWKQIAKYPPSYLKIGYLARSRIIFSEALVHVVGQWPAGANHIRSQLPEQVLELIEDKVDELEDMKAKIEGKLFRLTLTTPRGERVTPSNAYLAWTAVSLFRQWLAENTTPPPTPNPKEPPPPPPNPHHRDGHSHHHQRQRSQAALPPPPPAINTGRIYRLVGQGGSSYLPREELKRFLKLRPDEYNRENMRRFEARMDEIKNLARDMVKPLMRNSLELDLGRDAATGGPTGGLGYLTCTRIDEGDYPWME